MGTQVQRFASIDDVEWSQMAPPRVVFLDVEQESSAAAPEESDHSAAAVIARVKEYWSTCPIFVLHSEQTSSTIDAIAQGADDFIFRPLDSHKVRQRVDLRVASLERKAARETIRFGDMVIDTLQRSVSSAKGQKFLSPTEVRLISELAKAGGNVVSRELLKVRCWSQSNVSDNALNRKLYEIRRRIKPLSDNINIRTVYGVGFVLENKA